MYSIVMACQDCDQIAEEAKLRMKEGANQIDDEFKCNATF